MSKEFSVRDAGWATAARKLQHVRRTVFILEQQVPEDLELDEADAACLHAIAEAAAGNPIATGRLLADGHIGRIALAIEMAAARVPLLGVEGVRSRLDERFRLLSARNRTALGRHQTLRAATEWSHSHLSGPEQVVFRRIGVFAGGFPLRAAWQGRWETAARLRGYGAAAYAASGMREIIEGPIFVRLNALLAEHLGPEQIAALCNEGAAWTEIDVIAAANTNAAGVFDLRSK